MKRFVMFLIIIAVFLGIIIGMKNVRFEPEAKENEEDEITNTNEIYIDELNLPISEIDTLNPLITQNSQVETVLKLIYEPLVSYKGNEEIEPMLASEWAKYDSYTWIIKLRENVFWHDENMFNADDVIFTFNMLLNKELPYSQNLANVKECIKLDDISIKVILNNPDDYFISKLNFPIIPSHYFKGDNFQNEDKSNKPIGTGPYKYLNEIETKKVILEFNKKWWKSNEAKLTKINLCKYTTYGEAVKAFKSTEVDMIVTNMSEWKDKFGTIGINSYSFENSEYEVIIPNCNNISLSENSVRRAMLQAINRESIINNVYDDNAVISDVPVHTNSINNINNAEYDLEKAKQILINAGWLQDYNGWNKKINEKSYTLNFKLLVNKDNDKKVKVAERIKEDLKELGIDITINKVSSEDIKKAIAQESFDLILTSLDIKNEFAIQENVKEKDERNYSNYKSDSMSKIIGEMKKTDELYKNGIFSFVQLYKNDAPYIGLYFKTSTILTNKSVKGNLEPTWSNAYRNIISFCK